MYLGISDPYKYRIIYCRIRVLYEESKWWQFPRKKIIKEQLDWIYPLMKQEVQNLDNS